jgi:hypothetical protein
MVTADYNSLEMMIFLLERGADMEAKNHVSHLIHKWWWWDNYDEEDDDYNDDDIYCWWVKGNTEMFVSASIAMI